MSMTGLSEAASNVAKALQRPRLSPLWLASLVMCFDLPAIAVAMWFAQYASLSPAVFQPVWAAAAALLIAGVTVGLLALTGSYTPSSLQAPWRAATRSISALLGSTIVARMVLSDVAHMDFLVAAALALLIVVIPMRLVEASVIAWIVDTELVQRRAVNAGGGTHAERLIRGLAVRPGTDVRLYGIFDGRDDDRSPPQVLGIPKIGNHDDLVEFVRRSEVDMVIIALPLDAEERISWLLSMLRVLPVEVRLSTFSEDYAFPATLRDPLISAIRGTFAPERRLMKRSFEIVFTALTIMVVRPSCSVLRSQSVSIPEGQSCFARSGTVTTTALSTT